MTKRVCAFCHDDTKPLTLEHIYPDWLSKKFKSNIVGINEVTSDDGSRKWTKALFQEKSKIVCADCNNGFMSDIETRAKPILEKMILTRDRINLGEDEQKVLSLWIQKTILVMNLATGGKYSIPKSFYDKLYESKTEPINIAINAGWRMEMGDTKEVPLASFYIKQIGTIHEVKKEEEDLIRNDMKSGKTAWTSTLAIGFAVFQVFAHDMNGQLEVMGGDPRLLFPINSFSSPISWPLELPIDYVGGLKVIIAATDS